MSTYRNNKIDRSHNSPQVLRIKFFRQLILLCSLERRSLVSLRAFPPTANHRCHCTPFRQALATDVCTAHVAHRGSEALLYPRSYVSSKFYQRHRVQSTSSKRLQEVTLLYSLPKGHGWLGPTCARRAAVAEPANDSARLALIIKLLHLFTRVFYLFFIFTICLSYIIILFTRYATWNNCYAISRFHFAFLFVLYFRSPHLYFYLYFFFLFYDVISHIFIHLILLYFYLYILLRCI